MEKSLVPTMEEISVKNARKVVEAMLIERFVKGRDVIGLGHRAEDGFCEAGAGGVPRQP